ncbi:MAG: protein-glutamate O-methyltransferase CheR, partial [Candidatus Methylomirabilales bacterium]
MTDQEYQYLKQRIFKLTGLNLEAYKDTQMRRRLEAYVNHHQPSGALDFCRSLETQPQLLHDLSNYITINVSEFYRDLPSFEYLQHAVLPNLLRGRPSLNVWSAGCSAGQEPYSLAIMLNTVVRGLPTRILATDIDEEALRLARAGGPYSTEAVRSLSAAQVARYFVKSGAGFMVADEVRRAVEFRRQNLLDSEFEGGFDLIVCRNVTIYFTDRVKAELNRKFFRALTEGGVLFIGGTEVMLDA